MTIEADILELGELASRHPEIAGLLKASVAVGRKLDANTGIAGIVAAHQAPAKIHRETPEEEEWRRQTDGLISKGLHEALELEAEVYRSTFPRFNSRLKSDGYDRFLAVDPRIKTLSQLHQLLGIAEYINTTGISNVITIPQKPYVVCLQNGPVELFVGIFDQAMARIPRNGVAISFIEDDMTWLQFPELCYPWAHAGSSRYGAGYVPCLYVDGDGPKVNANWVDNPNRNWRLLSRGKRTWTSSRIGIAEIFKVFKNF